MICDSHLGHLKRKPQGVLFFKSNLRPYHLLVNHLDPYSPIIFEKKSGFLYVFVFCFTFLYYFFRMLFHILGSHHFMANQRIPPPTRNSTVTLQKYGFKKKAGLIKGNQRVFISPHHKAGCAGYVRGRVG